MKTELGLGETSHDTDPATDRTLAASSASLVGASSGAAGEPKRGDSIGRFVVLGVLGAGGMGVVYSAFDPHLDRKVAIKLLAANARNEAAKLRMLREAQAMAKINHPNVIKVHEVGTFEDQIYLAIEFADAGTVRGWLKDNRSQREILDVFSQAGRGLDAAHALGLVHRDFKPDNVLMTRTGSVLVTDFGLVSVTNAVPSVEQMPSDTSISQELTQTGSIMGTPTYMSPEQFKGDPVTARTDQFSFCVALYEALYRTRPFAGATYAELLVTVTSGDVSPPPNVKVPAWIRRVLLRGLATDPDKRFATMTDLLAALAHDPVRRRRRALAWTGAGMLATSAVAFAVLGHQSESCGGGDDRIAAVWNPVQRSRLASAFATSNRPMAGSTLARVTEIVDGWTGSWKTGYVAACRATRDGEQSAHVLDLRMECLTRALDEVRTTLDVLGSGGTDVVEHGLGVALELPSIAPCGDAAGLTADVAPPDPSVRQLVATVGKQIDQAKDEDHLGRYKAALATIQPAVAAARATHYAAVLDRALGVLAIIEGDLEQPNVAETYEEAMRVAAEAGDTRGLLRAIEGRFVVLGREGHFDAAQELADVAEALAVHAHLPVDEVVQLDDGLAYLLERRGKLEEAQTHYERALSIARREGSADGESVLITLSQLGALYKDAGQLDNAAKALEEAVVVAEKHFGKGNPEVANFSNDLGNVYRTQGRLADAKRLYDQALAIRIAALGPDHPTVGTSYNSLGTFYADSGDMEQAQSYYEKTLASWEKAYGKDSPELYPTLLNLGQAREARGDLAGARRDLERGRTLVEAARGPDHPDVGTALANLAGLADAEHRYTDALELFRKALAIYAKAGDAPDVADTTAGIANELGELGKLDEAEAMMKGALELEAKAYGADSANAGAAFLAAAKLEMERQNYAGALDDANRSLAILDAKFGKDSPNVAESAFAVGLALIALGRAHEAVAFEERALAIDVAANKPAAATATVRFRLAVALGEDPKTRARAVTEAKAALAALDAKEPDAVEVRTWLRVHR